METRIENGMTIITVGPGVANRANKTGYVGVTYVKRLNKYKADIVIKGYRYTLGFFEKASDAGAIRAEADRHKKNGDFIEWFKTRLN